jgi:hypothetical protein
MQAKHLLICKEFFVAKLTALKRRVWRKTTKKFMVTCNPTEVII